MAQNLNVKKMAQRKLRKFMAQLQVLVWMAQLCVVKNMAQLVNCTTLQTLSQRRLQLLSLAELHRLLLQLQNHAPLSQPLSQTCRCLELSIATLPTSKCKPARNQNEKNR